MSMPDEIGTSDLGHVIMERMLYLSNSSYWPKANTVEQYYKYKTYLEARPGDCDVRQIHSERKLHECTVICSSTKPMQASRDVSIFTCLSQDCPCVFSNMVATDSDRISAGDTLCRGLCQRPLQCKELSQRLAGS